MLYRIDEKKLVLLKNMKVKEICDFQFMPLPHMFREKFINEKGVAYLTVRLTASHYCYIIHSHDYIVHCNARYNAYLRRKWNYNGYINPNPAYQAFIKGHIHYEHLSYSYYSVDKEQTILRSITTLSRMKKLTLAERRKIRHAR